eukprot:8313237-Pyramimonas_sp.AAC.1
MGFFEVLCMPLFEIFCSIYPTCAPLRDQAAANLKFWSENQGNPERPNGSAGQSNQVYTPGRGPKSKQRTASYKSLLSEALSESSQE